jgi:hypothetical protein
MRQVALRIWDSPTLTTWGSVGLRSLSGLITAPLIVTHLPTQEIAVWYLISSIMALQPLLEMGFAPSFVRAIAYASGGATDIATGRRASHESAGSFESEQLIDRICITMRWLYARLGLLITVILALGGTLALYRSINATNSPGEAWISWLVILVGSPLVFRHLAASAYLQGSNRIPIFRRVEILGSAAVVIANATVLLIGGGLLPLAISSQFCLIAAAEWNYRLSRRLRPNGFAGAIGTPDRAILNTVWTPTWRSGVGMLMSHGVVQLSAIAYAQLGTPAEVAALLFALRILQILVSMCQAPFYSKIPQLVRLYSENRTDEQLRVAARGMALSYWTFVIGVVGVGIGINSLLTAIGSNVDFIDVRLWYLIGLAYVVERFGAMHIQLYSVTNHIIWHRANAVAGLLYISSLWLAYPSMGLYAFPTAIFAGYLGFYSWYAAMHSYHQYKLTFWQFESRVSIAPASLLLALILRPIF